MRAYPPPSFVFLAFLGAEIAGGGGRICPPSRARNSQTLSRGRARAMILAFLCFSRQDDSNDTHFDPRKVKFKI